MRNVIVDQIAQAAATGAATGAANAYRNGGGEPGDMETDAAIAAFSAAALVYEAAGIPDAQNYMARLGKAVEARARERRRQVQEERARRPIW